MEVTIAIGGSTSIKWTRSMPEESRRGMEHIGIDVHKKESQLCILTDAGAGIERWIRTD